MPVRTHPADPPSPSVPDLPAAGARAAVLPALALLAPALGEPSVAGSILAEPWQLATVLAAVALGALGTAAVASLIEHSPTRLQQILEEAGAADRDRRNAAIERFDLEYQLVGWLFVALGWCGGLWGASRLLAPGHWPLALVAFLLLMGFAAGSVPLALARLRPERVLLLVLPVLRATHALVRWPLVQPLLAGARVVLHLGGVRPTPPSDSAEVQQQVLAAVADTVTDGNLPAVERTWIGNIVGLQDMPVSTLMTPRQDVIAFAEATPLREVLQQALEHGFSRYPVYRERVDEMVGIFNVKDALRLAHDDTGKLAATPLRSMLREPLFVPETTGAAELLRRFQAGNQHMAIVIDEYGATRGLVTVEDVLERIVGDIGDEYDAPPASPQSIGEHMQVIEAGRVLEFPASTTVAEINALLDSELPEEGDWETIAGLVIAKLAHIPVVGETVTIDDVELRVLQADERRIGRLRATLLAPETAREQG